jgi:hypothetical protein
MSIMPRAGSAVSGAVLEGLAAAELDAREDVFAGAVRAGFAAFLGGALVTAFGGFVRGARKAA